MEVNEIMKEIGFCKFGCNHLWIKNNKKYVLVLLSLSLQPLLMSQHIFVPSWLLCVVTVVKEVFMK
jgi:hypothetical protein